MLCYIEFTAVPGQGWINVNGGCAVILTRQSFEYGSL